MLYRISNATVSAGGRQILSHINFEIKGKEKIAITGQNGAGKTTLLRLIMGQVEPDRDDRQQGPSIWSDRPITITMLEQAHVFPKTTTLEDYLLAQCPAEDLYSRERYEYELEFDRLFTGLGFAKEDKKKELGHFSGGEQSKIALICLLLQKPDLLLLDEPTNHLDFKALEWLEDYMAGYEKAVIFVSHDRFFLDQVTDVVYDLENQTLTRYVGNYTEFCRQKRKNRDLQRKAWERQQAEVDRLTQLIEKFKNKPRKAAFARSRKSLLERMEKMEKPTEDTAYTFSTPIEPAVPSGKWVLEAEHLKVGYDDPLFELTLRLRKGQKLGILGENGAGKTTLLKTLAGQLEPLEGSLSWGSKTIMGYFDQMTATIDSEQQIVEHFKTRFPHFLEKEVRQILGSYLFRGKDASKRIRDLSGGEKSRLLLCELMTERPNLLLLDEPTNHMDIPARETLESAFSAYKGSMLIISHDRYFLEQVADSLLILQEEGPVYYPFGYDHYASRRRRSGNGDISAAVQAENQALIEGLQAVPKAEGHRLREIDTESAYRDWMLSHKTEEVEQAMEAFEASLLEADEDLWDHKEEEWTSSCLSWYDLYLELTD